MFGSGPRGVASMCIFVAFVLRPILWSMTMAEVMPIQISVPSACLHDSCRGGANSHEKHSRAISDGLCVGVCNFNGVPQVIVYQITLKISVHFIMQPPDCPATSSDCPHRLSRQRLSRRIATIVQRRLSSDELHSDDCPATNCTATHCTATIVQCRLSSDECQL